MLCVCCNCHLTFSYFAFALLIPTMFYYGSSACHARLLSALSAIILSFSPVISVLVRWSSLWSFFKGEGCGAVRVAPHAVGGALLPTAVQPSSLFTTRCLPPPDCYVCCKNPSLGSRLSQHFSFLVAATPLLGSSHSRLP